MLGSISNFLTNPTMLQKGGKKRSRTRTRTKTKSKSKSKSKS
jgi:hypothetical protein